MRSGKNDWENLEKFFCRVFNILAVILFAVLFWNGLHLTGQNTVRDEYISFRQDSVIFNLFTVCAALAVLCFFGRIAEWMRGKRARNIALGVVCVLTAAISFYWVSVCKAAPEADQMMICQYADAFNLGDFGGLRKGFYIARYPQQLGMVTLLKGLFAIFGQYHYQAFQYLMVAVVPLIVFCGCKIVRLLSDDNPKAEIFYLLFILTCFPMYIYTSFVYGDLISTALGMFGVWMYLACVRKFSWIRILLFGLSIGMAVQLRANLMILAAALALVLVIKLMAERRWQGFVPLVSLILGIVLMNAAVWGLYRDVMEEKAPSVPPLLYIVMGMNDTNGHPGWYNAYNWILFAENGDNPELVNSLAREHLRESLQKYWEDPDYMTDFFGRKMNAQWNAPMYQCIAMNRNIAEPQTSRLARDITNYGSVARGMEAWMKVYQLLLYGGILFLLVTGRKKFVRMEKYVLLVAVYGGFLFSLIWEAKTRYVLPFLFFQIPYMALGVSGLVSVPAKLPGLWRDMVSPGRFRQVRLRAADGRRHLAGGKYFLAGCAAVLAAHMALALFFGVQKSGFHEEEYHTYHVSSGSAPETFRDPVDEMSGYIVQSKFLVTAGNRFHYDAVAKAGNGGVHPPLYYLALHTLMSLAPDSFYKWFGIGLNVLCSLVSCAGVIALVLTLDKSRHRRLLALVAGLAYAVSPAALSNIMFAGVRAMSVMWIVLYAELLVIFMGNLRRGKEKWGWFAVVGGIVGYLAFLTDYFAFAVILCLTLAGCAAAGRKGIARMLRCTGILLVFAGLALWKFPFSVRHILLSPGGAFGEAFPVLASLLVPLALCGGCKAGLALWEKKGSGGKIRLAGVLATAAVLVCSGAGTALGGVRFLYRGVRENVEYAKANSHCPAVVVYGYDGHDPAWYASNWIWCYEDVIYADYLDGEYVLVNGTLEEGERFIVYMNCPEDILEYMIARNDNLHSYSLVRRDNLFCVYEVE